MRKTYSCVLSALLVVSATAAVHADDVLEINRSFLDKYKNRLTISVPYIVDAAHKNPNPPAKDGDMHIAGRSPGIGLATVAEIQNAKDAGAAIQRVKSVEGTPNQIQVTGVWRIWPEHGGDNDHIQKAGPGTRYTKTGPTNPPHVFEIHPILKIENEDLHSTLEPIKDFDPKNASDAFPRYERASFEIAKKGKRVVMHMRMVGFNYVDFIMRLKQRFDRVDDGEFVSASIYSTDKDEELLVHDRRIGFVAGTAADAKQRGMQVGDCMRVLGLPRVDLTLVGWRLDNAKKRPDALKWSMPYEMIAVGVYDDQPKPCGDE